MMQVMQIREALKKIPKKLLIARINKFVFSNFYQAKAAKNIFPGAALTKPRPLCRTNSFIS